MVCTVFRLDAGPQTGKSLIARGALEMVAKIGGKALLISETLAMAHCVKKQHGLTCEITSRKARPSLSGFSAVAVDEADNLTGYEINEMRKELDKTNGPSMLLVVTTKVG